MWAKWKELFLTVANKHAPIKSGRVRNKNSPWINSEIRKLIIERDCLKKQAIKTGNRDDWIKFKKVKNKTNRIIKETKANYYKSNIDSTSGNPRAIWKTLNELMGRNAKSSGINSIKIDNVAVTDSQQICELMNSHFTSVGTKLASSLSNSDYSFVDYLKDVRANCFCASLLRT